jgi:hypothetical protein
MPDFRHPRSSVVELHTPLAVHATSLLSADARLKAGGDGHRLPPIQLTGLLLRILLKVLLCLAQFSLSSSSSTLELAF